MTKNNNTKYHNGIASNDTCLSRIKNNGLFLRFFFGGGVLFLALLYSSASLATIFTAKPGELVTLKTSFSSSTGTSAKTIGSNATRCYLAGFSRQGNVQDWSLTAIKKTIDGYTGFTHNGILIMITGGSVSTRVNTSTGNVSRSVSFSPSGVPSAPDGSETDSSRYCWTITGTSSTRGEAFYVSNLEIKAYIPKDLAPGNYPLPPLITGSFVTNSNISLLSSADSINVVPPLACTISAPPTIDFGNVNVFGKDLSDDATVLAVSSGSIGISCSSSSPDAQTSASVWVLGEKGRYTNTLALPLENGNPSPAEIRGFMGPNISTAGSCAGGDGWLQFTNADRKIPIGTLSVGNNSVPYSFSLCPSGNPSNVTGRASATATINVSWD